MGRIHYGAAVESIAVPDRMLSHVKVVVITKLRRNECFTLSWRHGEHEPLGRSTIWLQSSIPLRFVFDEPEPPPLDRELLAHLAEAANSSAGLVIDIDEAPAEPVAVEHVLQPA